MNSQLRHCLAIWTTIAANTILAGQFASTQCFGDSPTKTESVGYDDFYRSDEIQSIFLQVTPEDQKRMLAALPERIAVPASFRWRDLSIPNVSVRFKGNSSSAPSQQHKRSFLIKFDEYEADQRFLGLRRVSFDNGVQFGSIFSEPVITEILRDVGITSHRCNYAKLYLNEEYKGVYVNVERIDESFIERHLPDHDGMMFKVDQGGPGANLQFVDGNPGSYGRTFEPQTKSAKKGQRKLVEFIRMINQSNADEIMAVLDSKFELDEFLDMTAILLFSGAFDQLTGWNPHNYYLYHDEKKDRWRYLPWDLDVGFCESAFGQIQVLTDWNAAWPVAGQLPNPLLDRIVANPVLLKRYRDKARIILDKYFEPGRLCAIVDAKYQLIKSDLKTDPFPHRRITNPQDQNYDGIVASIKSFITKRYATARQQLDNPGERPAMARRPEGPMPPIVDKIKRLQRLAEQMQQNGEDVLPIQKIMQQVGPLLQRGKMADAEELVIKALKLAGDDPTPEKDSPRREK